MGYFLYIIQYFGHFCQFIAVNNVQFRNKNKNKIAIHFWETEQQRQFFLSESCEANITQGFSIVGIRIHTANSTYSCILL